MKELTGIVLLIVASWQPVLAQGPQPQPPTRPRFEDTLAKSVVRIVGAAEGLTGSLNGTGFLVAIPETRIPGNRAVVYLVTNRHVAKAMFPDSSGAETPHKVTMMRAVLNLKAPSNGNRTTAVPLPPEDGRVQWHFPADDSIDLAIVAFQPKDEFDVLWLSPSFFFTRDTWPAYRIGPGDKVLTCGYFLHYAGAHQFQPIIREGSFAMVPDDAMPVAIGGSAKIYLADLHVIPGNSGSPLFLAPGFTMGGRVTDASGGIPYGLLGIVSGYMWEDTQLTMHVANDFEGTLHANSGIATIVPVDQLKELLFSAEVQRERDIALEDYKRTHPN